MGTLVNAIKAIFASKKTTDSNYAVPLLNKNDASPAGYMELPDLAAVAAGALALKRTAASMSVGTSDYEYYYKIDASGYRVIKITLYCYEYEGVADILFIPGANHVVYMKRFGGEFTGLKVYSKAGSLIIHSNIINSQIGVEVVSRVLTPIISISGTPNLTGYTEVLMNS